MALRETDANQGSHWLRDQERAGHIGAGTTLRGLRVTYAAWWKRNGGECREVADLLGDESEAMGAHYECHVDVETNINLASSPIKNAQRQNVNRTGFAKHQ